VNQLFWGKNDFEIEQNVCGRNRPRPKRPVTQSSVGKKDGDWSINPQFLVHKNFNIAQKRHRKVLTFSSLAYTIPLAQGQILQKYGFPCTLWAV